MNRIESAKATAQALAIIGTKRAVCPTCAAPLTATTYGGSVHTARSAAMAMGVDPQAVYRAVRKAQSTKAS